MKSNLFVSLFKYRPRPNRNPLEDFTTESIRYLLQNNKHFLKQYLELFLKRSIQLDGYKIETQFPIETGRIDMAIFWTENDNEKQYSLFIEHKVWSSPWEYEDDEGLKEDQISNYCKYQEKHSVQGYSNNYVVLVSNYPVPGYAKDEITHCSYLDNFTWDEIANLLKEQVTNQAHQNTVFELEKEFIDFMRRENMAGFEDFSITELSSIKHYKEFEEKRGALTNKVIQFFKDDTFNVYNLKRYNQVKVGSRIGDYFGVIFHNASGNELWQVEQECSIWIFFGLATNKNDAYQPDSLFGQMMIPDVECAINMWFDNSKQLKEFQEKYALNKWEREHKNQFEAISRTDGDINWLAIMKRESLLYFLPKNNHEQEIYNFLKDGSDAIISKGGEFDRIIRDFLKIK